MPIVGFRLTLCFVIAAVAGLALAGAACSPAPPATPTQTSTKVSIALNWVLDATFSPFLYGVDKGFFREQGIDVELIPGRGSDLAMTQINDNKVQFAITDLLTYLAQRAKNQTPTMAIMSHIDVPTIGLVSTTPIKMPQELVGKSWATTASSSGRFLLPLALQSKGVDPSTVRIDLVDFSVLYPTLFEGKFDSAEAHTTGSLAGVMLAAEKAGKPLYWTPLSDWGLKGYAKMLIVRDDTLKSNPDLVRRLTAALVRSINEARANATDDEVFNLLVKSEPQIQKAEALLQWKQFKEAVKNPGPISAVDIEENLRYMATGQDIRTDLKPDQLYTNAFLPKS